MHAQSKSMGKALKLGGNWVTTDPLKRSFYYYGRMKKVNFRLMDLHLFRPTVTAVVAMLSPRSCCWTARTALVPSMLTASRNCRATRNIQIKKSKKNCKNFARIVHISFLVNYVFLCVLFLFCFTLKTLKYYVP